MGGDFFVGELNVAVGDTVPVALMLEDQSYFALGYYQVSAELNRRRAEYLAENRRKQTQIPQRYKEFLCKKYIKLTCTLRTKNIGANIFYRHRSMSLWLRIAHPGCYSAPNRIYWNPEQYPCRFGGSWLTYPDRWKRMWDRCSFLSQKIIQTFFVCIQHT